MSCFCVRDMVLASYCVAYCPQIFKWMCCWIVHRPIFRYHENGLKARLTGNEWKCCVLPQSLTAATNSKGCSGFCYWNICLLISNSWSSNILWLCKLQWMGLTSSWNDFKKDCHDCTQTIFCSFPVYPTVVVFRRRHWMNRMRSANI